MPGASETPGIGDYTQRKGNPAMIKVLERTVFDKATNARVTKRFEIVIDEAAILNHMAQRSFESKSGMARDAGGGVIVNCLA